MDFIWDFIGSINSGLLGGMLAVPATALVAYTCKLDRPKLSGMSERIKKRGLGNWGAKYGTLWAVSFFGLFLFLMFGLIGIHDWLIDPLLNSTSLTFLWVAHPASVFPMFGISIYISMNLCRKWGLNYGGMAYKRYATIKALQYKIDPFKAQKRLLRPLQILSIIGLIAASFVHVSIKGSNFSHLPYLEIEKTTFDLSNAKEVTIYSKSIAPNGDVVNNSDIVIKFKNGQIFNSHYTQLYFAAPRMLELAKLVEKHSNIKLKISNTVNPN